MSARPTRVVVSGVPPPPITSDANRDASFFLKSDDFAAEHEKGVALAGFPYWTIRLV